MNVEAALTVAVNSKQKAQQYLETGNSGRAFAHFLLALKLQPLWKSELKQPITVSLCALGNYLEQQKRYKDLYNCYEQALEFLPDNEEILNNLGAHLFRSGHVVEAKNFFNKSLSVNPKFLPAIRNLDNVSSFLVEHWHFRMLNDVMRNEAYREAIFKKVQQGFNSVLDIGTGTGLLSLYSKNAGAKEIYACDCSSTMVHIANQVFEANNASDSISLLSKVSTDLKIPEDIPHRVKLVVTETMDAGLLGEHVLQTLSHAWEHLLLPPCPGLSTKRSGQSSSFSSGKSKIDYGIVIPLGASVWVAAVECDHLMRTSTVPEKVLTDLELDPNTFQILAYREEPYDSEDFTKLSESSKLLTTPQDVLYINFNDPVDIIDTLEGKKDLVNTISCCEAGRVDAIIAWFSLRLDEDILVSSAPGQGSCWEQAIFHLKEPIHVQSGEKLKVHISSLSGKLSVNIIQENDTKDPFLFSENTIRFLNNEPWVQALMNVVAVLENKKNLKILDLSPFPLLGLILLIKGSVSHVTCVFHSDVDSTCAKELAGDPELLTFIPEDKLNDLTTKFDVIILHPISQTGELDQNSFLQIPVLRNLLVDGGILLPKKISICAQVVQSDWLTKMSRLENNDAVNGYQISEFINAYQVTQHLDLRLSTLECTELTERIKLLEFIPSELDLSMVTKSTEVTIHRSGNATAIPYWFELTWADGDDAVSTRDLLSHVNQAAVLCEPLPVNLTKNIVICATQQQGYLNFEISDTL